MTPDISKLTALHFQTEDLTPEMDAWYKNPENLVIKAQNCFRTVLLGLRDRFDSAPYPRFEGVQESQQKYHVHYGRDAYIYLLHILTGLTDQQEFDPHLRGSFEARWQRFSQNKRINIKLIEPFICALRADCDLIFNQFTQHIINVRASKVIEFLTSGGKGPNALIITDRPAGYHR